MSADKKWGVFEETSESHVVPLNDSGEHLLVSNCPCRPQVLRATPLPIIVHAAWDCRELIEQAEEIKETAGA